MICDLEENLLFGVNETITYGMLKGEPGYFEDSKPSVDEVGRNIDFKRARRILTYQSSVHGGGFQI